LLRLVVTLPPAPADTCGAELARACWTYLEHRVAEALAPAFTATQSKKATALRHRQKTEDQQLHNAAAAKRDFDRVAEVQARREPARGIERERQRGRGGPDSSPV